MKATISLDGILTFLRSLSLSASNKRWLAEKLLEEAQEEQKTEKLSYEEFVESLCGAWNDDPRSTEEIKNDIRNSRQFGVTRHIMPLNDEKRSIDICWYLILVTDNLKHFQRIKELQIENWVERN